MPVNLDKPLIWKSDIAASVDMYNLWFMEFAPKAFRDTRVQTTIDVERTLAETNNLRNVSPEILKKHPAALPTLRMSTCPPIAVDRLIGLANVSPNLVKCMELEKKLPTKLIGEQLNLELAKIGDIIQRMADPDIFTWLNSQQEPSKVEIHRAATIVADRLCGSVANPIIRNAQEKRQLAAIKVWLEDRGYKHVPAGSGLKYDVMQPGTFSFRLNIPVTIDANKKINIPIDAAIKLKSSSIGDLPLLFEAKSAGDFANVNKRRKEEAVKMSQLKKTYGDDVSFNLFLCGYFDGGYLGYEASEGIDWVWEHRIDDLQQFGI